MNIKFKPQIFQLAKNLTRQEAFIIAKKKATKDFRGFNYNPKTGIARLI
jgi:hypothetical protein